MRIEVTRAERHFAGAAIVLVAGAIVFIVLRPDETLAGWLAAAALFQSIPMTAIILLLMMRLISGAWEPALRPACEAALMLLPFAAVAFLPVLFGIEDLYPWVTLPRDGFKGVWLGIVPFTLRTALWFAGLLLLAWRLLVRRPSAVDASVGLILITAFGSLVMVDWLMTLSLDFVSSGFGLQVIALGMTAGLAALLIGRLATGTVPVRLGIVGALLLTLLLLWAYFQFLSYFIIWSGNLAGGADWYFPRSHGGWQYALLAACILGGVPLLALMLPTPRTQPRWLLALSVAVLAGKAIEFAWLAVPPHGLMAVIVFVLAGAGFACLGALVFSYRGRKAA